MLKIADKIVNYEELLKQILFRIIKEKKNFPTTTTTMHNEGVTEFDILTKDMSASKFTKLSFSCFKKIKDNSI